MYEFKPGDRVKVEFEGEVIRSSFSGMYLVDIEDSKVMDVNVKHLTLIEPEIVLPEIPGKIVQIDPLDEYGQRAAFELQIEWWFESGGGTHLTDELIEKCRQYGYRVIPAAEAEGVSE